MNLWIVSIIIIGVLRWLLPPMEIFVYFKKR
jgi:hypothetical protein